MYAVLLNFVILRFRVVNRPPLEIQAYLIKRLLSAFTTRLEMLILTVVRLHIFSLEQSTFILIYLENKRTCNKNTGCFSL